MSTFDNESLHALSGAYAVDALDDTERAAFEQHLLDSLSGRFADQGSAP